MSCTSSHRVVDGDCSGNWRWHEGVSHLLVSLLEDLWGLGIDGGLSVDLGVVVDNWLLLGWDEDRLLHWLLSNNLGDSLLLVMLLPAAFPPVVFDASDGLDGFLGLLESLDEPEVDHHEHEWEDSTESGKLAAMFLSSVLSMSSMSLVVTSVEFLGSASLNWSASNDDGLIRFVLLRLDSWWSLVSSLMSPSASVVTSSLVLSSTEWTSELLWFLILVLFIFIFLLWSWWWSSMMMASAESIHESLEEGWLFLLLVKEVILADVRAIEDGWWK